MLNLNDQSVSELLKVEPPISEDNPVTPTFAEAALETAGDHFDKALASLYVAQKDPRVEGAQLSMLFTAMGGLGESLRQQAQVLHNERTDSPPPGEGS